MPDFTVWHRGLFGVFCFPQTVQKSDMRVKSSMAVILQLRPYGLLSFQNGGESNENTLEIRLTNIRYINSLAQTQLFFRLFPRKFQCSPSFNALLRVELAIYPMFIYKRLLMFSIDIHLNSCFSSFLTFILSFLCIRTAVHEWGVSLSFFV